MGDSFVINPNGNINDPLNMYPFACVKNNNKNICTYDVFKILKERGEKKWNDIKSKYSASGGVVI